MIAMALALEPEVLIADEPTTALDVTVQAQILGLLERLNRERGLATILITHDLGVVAEVADRVLVMYAGRIVEQGTLDEIFYDPQHPYTWGLLGSLTRLDEERPQRLPQIPGAPPSLLDPRRRLRVPATLPARLRRLRAAAGPRAAPGRAPRATCDRCRLTPSRSASAARSTAASGWRRRRERSTARGHRPGQALPGQARAADRPRGRPGAGGRRRQPQRRPRRNPRPGRRVGQRQVDPLPHDPATAEADLGLGPLRGPRDRRPLAAPDAPRCGGEMQMVFQDPFASLNPRKRAGQIVGDPLRMLDVASGSELRRRVQELLERVGLSAEHYDRYPHEFSGGQRQRIGIARALGAAAEADRRRRAGLRPRRLDPGADRQPARRTCRTSSASPTCSSPTTSASSATSPTGSRSCTTAGSSRRGRRTPSASARRDPYTKTLLAAVPIPDPREARARRAAPASARRRR